MRTLKFSLILAASLLILSCDRQIIEPDLSGQWVKVAGHAYMPDTFDLKDDGTGWRHVGTSHNNLTWFRDGDTLMVQCWGDPVATQFHLNFKRDTMRLSYSYRTNTYPADYLKI